MKKLLTSFKNINHKLFLALLVMGLVPTIYTTLRVFYLGNMPGDWSYSIRSYKQEKRKLGICKPEKISYKD